MRIISGSHRGRILHPPKNLKLRPTTDIAKEALFNVLYNYFDFEDLTVLDLFAGTGAIGCEFASRGSEFVTAVEINNKAAVFIRKTAEELNFNIQVITADVFRFIPSCKIQYNLIFADPPYDLQTAAELPNLIFKHNLLANEGWFVMEHSKSLDFSKHQNLFDHRKYGKVNFSIFKNITQISEIEKPKEENLTELSE